MAGAELMALQGCMRVALGCFLPSDEVEVGGKVGLLERLHEDRTCTVSFADQSVPPSLAREESQLPRSTQQPSVQAVEVRAGQLVDVVTFVFADGGRRSFGEAGGDFAGRFALEEGEVLSRVSGTAGDSLDSVQFHTSRGRASQVFGNAGGGGPFELSAPSGHEVVGLRRGVRACAAIRDLVCAPSTPAFPPGQRVQILGLASEAGQQLNGRRGTVLGPAASEGRVSVSVDDSGAKAIKAENLVAAADPGPSNEGRFLLRDCRLHAPKGNFWRSIATEHDVQLLTWQGRAELRCDGRAHHSDLQSPPVGREGVHYCLSIVRSDPIPDGVQITSVEMRVSGMDQGWGSSGDSGVVLYVARAGADTLSPWDGDDPLLKVTYDHNRHPDPRHAVRLTDLAGPMAPQPGDCLEAVLQCPNYPGWSAFAAQLQVQVHCRSEQEEVLPGCLEPGWEAQSGAAFDRIWEGLGDDARLSVDRSHLSLRGQERQRVWAPAAAAEGPDRGPVLARAAKMGRTPDGRAEKLLEKLDSNSTTAGSPQDPGLREARYRALRALVHRTLDGLEGRADLLDTVLHHYGEASAECIYRWDREISNMHDLVTGEAAGSDALEAEDSVLKVLCAARRQIAEEALHQAKGRAENSDMHFENFFYGSIHFGLPEQIEAARDPNRLNYGSLNMLRPEEVRQQLARSYAPARIRGILRERILESKETGAQALREKLLDWLRARTPPGFRPQDEPEARREAWLFEQCHDESFRLRDEALNFALCCMHVLRPEGLVCLAGDPATAVAPTRRGDAAPPRPLGALLRGGQAEGRAVGAARGPPRGAAAEGGRCAVQ